MAANRRVSRWDADVDYRDGRVELVGADAGVHGGDGFSLGDVLAQVLCRGRRAVQLDQRHHCFHRLLRLSQSLDAMAGQTTRDSSQPLATF